VLTAASLFPWAAISHNALVLLTALFFSNETAASGEGLAVLHRHQFSSPSHFPFYSPPTSLFIPLLFHHFRLLLLYAHLHRLVVFLLIIPVFFFYSLFIYCIVLSFRGFIILKSEGE
jgi:hypothetical protein